MIKYFHVCKISNNKTKLIFFLIINIYDLKTQKSYLLRNIASTLSKQGDHDKALKNDFEAVEIAKEFDNQQQVALLYNDIALEYKIQKKYQKAI